LLLLVLYFSVFVQSRSAGLACYPSGACTPTSARLLNQKPQ
jgi:hypothetical protein